MKTRPIPSKNAHLKNVIFKLESYSKLKRWKLHFFDRSNEIVNNFEFKSILTSSKRKELSAFEEDLSYLLRNIEFERIITVFENQIKDITMDVKVACVLKMKLFFHVLFLLLFDKAN